MKDSILSNISLFQDDSSQIRLYPEEKYQSKFGLWAIKNDFLTVFKSVKHSFNIVKNKLKDGKK